MTQENLKKPDSDFDLQTEITRAKRLFEENPRLKDLPAAVKLYLEMTEIDGELLPEVREIMPGLFRDARPRKIMEQTSLFPWGVLGIIKLPTLPPWLKQDTSWNDFYKFRLWEARGTSKDPILDIARWILEAELRGDPRMVELETRRAQERAARREEAERRIAEIQPPSEYIVVSVFPGETARWRELVKGLEGPQWIEIQITRTQTKMIERLIGMEKDQESRKLLQKIFSVTQGMESSLVWLDMDFYYLNLARDEGVKCEIPQKIIDRFATLLHHVCGKTFQFLRGRDTLTIKIEEEDFWR